MGFYHFLHIAPLAILKEIISIQNITGSRLGKNDI
jgi:hypothetical protein